MYIFYELNKRLPGKKDTFLMYFLFPCPTKTRKVIKLQEVSAEPKMRTTLVGLEKALNSLNLRKI